MLFVAYFASPHNRIYLDIVKNDGKGYLVSISASGNDASMLMDSIKSTIVKEEQKVIRNNSQKGRANRDSQSL